MKMMRLAVVLLFILLTAFGFLLYKTYSTASLQLDVEPSERPPIKEGWAERLSQAIQVKTINFENQSLNDTAEFERMTELLLKNYPLVSKTMEVKKLGYSLLYKWKGRDSSKLAVLYMAHLDVVPVEEGEASWQQPPFSGTIAEGFIWGRGSMDIKNLACGMLEAAEYLISKGYQPQTDIYFAMGQDEETGGAMGNAKIAQYFEQNNIRFQYVLDEGLFVVSGVFPGINKPVALVGIAEKGSADLKLTALSEGGHASNPPKNNAVAMLSQAILNVNQKGFTASISGATKEMFRFLAPEMSFPFNLFFANMWLFEPMLVSQLDRPPTMSSIRTTVAPTILEGSHKVNVLPQKASAVLDLRLLPGETQATAVEKIKQLIDNDRIKVEPLQEFSPIDNPSPISCVDCESFALIHKSIKAVFGQVLVAPSLFVARSDSKYYIKLSENVYRFNPLELTSDDISRFHGTNERISLSNYEKIIHFYVNLMEKN